jgi:hypothetical protein
MDDDTIPTGEVYKGVGIHRGQNAKRRAIVRKAIDQVCETADPADLFVIAMDASVPPEARVLAATRLLAPLQEAANSRVTRPRGIDYRAMEAVQACLSSRRWQDPVCFGTLLEGEAGKVKRERLLA